MHKGDGTSITGYLSSLGLNLQINKNPTVFNDTNAVIMLIFQANQN